VARKSSHSRQENVQDSILTSKAVLFVAIAPMFVSLAHYNVQPKPITNHYKYWPPSTTTVCQSGEPIVLPRGRFDLWVEADLCTGCGFCVSGCPVDSISLEKRPATNIRLMTGQGDVSG
jgi:ferredoxin